MSDVDKKIQQVLDKENILEAEDDLILESINALRDRLTAPTGMTITQLNSRHKENSMSTTPVPPVTPGTPAGGTSTFAMAYTPTGSVAPSGTTQTWTVDDTADITLTPSADGTTCSATCVASPAATSYNLTCTSSYTPPGAPTPISPISAMLNVPIGAAPPPPVVLPTGMTITQTS